jgi:hypothetical protein
VIATYLRNTSSVIPRMSDEDADRKLWRKIARDVAEEALKDRGSSWLRNITLAPY